MEKNENKENSRLAESKRSHLKITTEGIKKIIKANLEFQKKAQDSARGNNSENFPLVFYPKAINFEDVVPSRPQVVDVEIWNRSDRLQRISLQIQGPSTFSIEGSDNFTLNSCMKGKLRVTFSGSSEDGLSAEICVKCDNQKMVIPIKLVTPKNVIEFETLKSLGDVQPNTPVSVEVEISNNSARNVIIESFTENSQTISAQNLPLNMQSQTKHFIVFQVQFSTIGKQKIDIFLSANGFKLDKAISFTANVTLNSLHIQNENGKELGTVNFGTLFIGETVTTNLFLVNNSSQKRVFAIDVLKSLATENADDESVPMTPFRHGLELLSRRVFIEPVKGCVEPFSQIPVKVTFYPVPSPQDNIMFQKCLALKNDSPNLNSIQNHANEVKYSAQFNFDDMQHNKTLKIFAKTKLPFLRVSKSVIDFGILQLGGSKLDSIWLQSITDQGPIHIEAEKSSFLHLTPSTLALKPDEKVEIKMNFAPKNLGNFCKNFVFKINKIFDLNVMIKGSSVTQLAFPSPNETIAAPRLQNSVKNSQEHIKLPEIRQLKTDRSLKQSRSILDESSNFPIKINNQKLSQYLGQKIKSRPISQRKKLTALNEMLDFKFTSIPKVPTTINDIAMKINQEGDFENIQEVFLVYSDKPFAPFPDFPKNFKETKFLTEELTPQELMKLQVASSELNFGQLFVGSKSTQYFQIKNNLFNPISVAVYSQFFQLDSDKTKPEVQVIPAGSVAGFKIEVCSSELGKISKRVLYIVNERHRFNFLVLADFVQHNLQLSKPIVEFKYKTDSGDFELTENLLISNTGNDAVEFEILEPQNSLFCVERKKGIVQKNSSFPVKIKFTPLGSRIEEILTLKILNGPTRELRCIGYSNETQCELQNSTFNIGEFSICKRQKGTVSIRNTHSVYCAVFKVDEQTIPPELQFSQTKGKINPNDSFKLEYEFWSSSEITYRDAEIKILVRGSSNPLVFLFSANCIKPDIVIEEKIMNFGVIPFGSKAVHPLTIINNSGIVAKLFLNLFSSDQKMSLAYTALSISEKDQVEPGAIKILDNENVRQEFIRNSKSIMLMNNNAEPSKLDDLNSKAKISPPDSIRQVTNNEENQKLVVFTLKPLKTYKFLLEFVPPKPTVYEFDLDFYLKGNQSEECLKRKITCTSKTRKLFVDPLCGNINFGEVIIQDGQKVPEVAKKSITFTNPHFSEIVRWQLDAQAIKNQTNFNFSQLGGTIQPLCSSNLAIEFYPIKPQNYKLSIKLIINEKEEEMPITITGQGAYPKPLISCDHLVLPVVPLGISTFGFVALKNIGYRSAIMSVEIGEEFTKYGLNVSFLEGSTFSSDVKRLILKVSFSSKISICFCCKVDIKDNFGRIYSFMVSAASDNCLLSYHAYLFCGLALNTCYRKKLSKFKNVQKFDENYQKTLHYAIDPISKQPVISCKSSITKKESNTWREDDLQENTELIYYYKRVSRSIQNFLEEIGIYSVSKFPKSLINNNGVQLGELFELLASKKVFKKPVFSPDVKGIEKIKKTVEFYDEFLASLKEKGGFSLLVQSRYLLSFKEYQLIMKGYQSSSVHPKFYQFTESEFKLISLQNWTTLFLQFIKVTTLTQINLASLKTNLQLLCIPSISNLPAKFIPQKEIASSQTAKNLNKSEVQKTNRFKSYFQFDSQLRPSANDKLKLVNDKNDFFSLSELCILTWMECALEHNSDENIRLSSFIQQPKNLETFNKIIENYASYFVNSSENKFEREEKSQSSQQKLIKWLNKLGISDIYHEDLVTNPFELDFLFFSMNLFKLLPSFTPKSTVLFQIPIHERGTKEIALKNSGDRPVTYKVIYIGDSHFEINLDQVLIDPKQSAKIPVTFVATSSTSAAGIVLFQNVKNGKSRANSLAFNLKGVVSKLKIFQQVKFGQIPLYESSAKQLTIPNPFDRDATFTISFSNEFNSNVYPENSSKIEPKNQKDENSLASIPQFFSQLKTIYIKSKSSAEIEVVFLPFCLMEHKCYMKLCAPGIGEFDYELSGKAVPPRPCLNQQLSIHLDGNLFTNVTVPSNNDMLTTALVKHHQVLSDLGLSKHLANLEKLMLNNEHWFEVEMRPGNVLTFEPFVTLKSNPEYFLTNEFVENGSEKTLRLANKGSIPLRFGLKRMEALKETEFTLTLRSMNKVDVRIMEFSLIVFSKIVKNQISIKTTARVPAYHTIQLSNVEEFDQNFNVNVMSNSRPEALTIQTYSFVIKPKKQFQFMVQFTPSWIMTAECTFQICNSKTNWTVEYQVKAVAEDPVFEANEAILMKLGEEKKISLRLVNPIPSSKEFKTECDVPDAIFAPNINFKNAILMYYPITIRKTACGNFMHSVKFTDAQGRYFWYLLSLQVEPDMSGNILELNTEQRKAVHRPITVHNNSNLPKKYKVVIKGQYLCGNEIFMVPENSVKDYDLFYFPLKQENKTKQVGFVDEENNEMWFNIKCTAVEPSVTELPHLVSEIGKTVRHSFTINNPLKNRSVLFYLTSELSPSFHLTPPAINVGSSDFAEFFIHFTPNSTEKELVEKFEIETKELGVFKFKISGSGTHPKKQPETVFVFGDLNRKHAIISFRNPFTKPAGFKVILENEPKSADVFRLDLENKDSLELDPKQEIHFAVDFYPKKLEKYRGTLKVTHSDVVEWVYPIMAKIEPKIVKMSQRLVTKSGVETQFTDWLNLQDFGEGGVDEEFQLTWKLENEKLSHFEKWIRVDKSRGNSTCKKIIPVVITFNPFKPFKSNLILFVQTRGGSEAKFLFPIESSLPEFFDFITFKAQVNQRHITNFTLYNSDKKSSSEFNAYFTEESDSSFQIETPTGSLEPVINNGTKISFSFFSSSFGKPKSGILVVETELFMWRFQIKAIHKP